MKMDAEHIRTIVGIIGNVTSFFLFASPCPTFWRILKNKSVEEFQPYPYLACVMNCMMWIFYGLPIVHPDSILVVTINGIGLVMELIYIAIYFYYGEKKRCKVGIGLALELFAMGGIATGVLLGEHTHVRRSAVVGIICIIFGIIMYSSPLLIMKKVIETKSVEFLPVWISVANLSNGLIWTAYALLQFDLYILIANGTGAVVNVVQLILYLAYFRTPESKQANKKLPTTTNK